MKPVWFDLFEFIYWNKHFRDFLEDFMKTTYEQLIFICKQKNMTQANTTNRGLTYPNVPITRVVTCVFESNANFASPKSETCWPNNINKTDCPN